MCVWIDNADGIEMDSRALDILFLNHSIKSFIERDSKKFGLSGIKGQGKTFLIKLKRKSLQNYKDNVEDRSIVCLPRNKMIAVFDGSIHINYSNYNYLDDFSKWIEIWKVALVITLMQDKECEGYFKNINFEDFGKAKEIILKLLKWENTTSSITNVFSKILILNKKELNILLTHTNLLMLCLDRITSGVCIFVDKLDQVFDEDKYPSFGSTKSSSGPRNASFWQYAQFAIACMSYDVYNFNNHIKVYYTIREEALVDAEKLKPNTYRNVSSFIMHIRYTKQELYEMFCTYIKAEDGRLLKDSSLLDYNLVKAFIGFDTIEHLHLNKIENVFDYIYRHSMKRPCDIMKICNDLSNKLTCLDEILFRRAVNNIARSQLKIYMEEKKPFLPCSYDELINVLIGLNTNVFTLEYMKNVCDRYNLSQGNVNRCTRNCQSCQSLQPFSVLHNLGLLGYIKEPTLVMHFLEPGNSILSLNEHSLGDRKLYFLHPCLSDRVSNERKNAKLNFYLNNVLLISDGMVISNEELRKAMKNARTNEKKLIDEKIFISSTVDDLHIERNITRKRIFELKRTPIMSEYEDFRTITNLNLHSHDVCIGEALQCNHMILIIGKSYGGKYAGNKYSKIQEIIIKESRSKITSPSITLMEFYCFYKKRKHFHIFVSEKIMNTLNNEYLRKEAGIDLKIIDEVKFLNHLAHDGQVKGNWLHVYTDENDFKDRVDRLIFN